MNYCRYTFETFDESLPSAWKLIKTFFQIFPQISRRAIISDLRQTGSVDVTTENILEGQLDEGSDSEDDPVDDDPIRIPPIQIRRRLQQVQQLMHE